MLRIGPLTLKNQYIMAPMAGITNLPFRLLVKKMGAGLVTTEMISAVGLSLAHNRSCKYLESHPDEKPLAVQIFGSEPETMAKAAMIVVEAGADVVDINMGCPAKKVVKNGSGGALLRDTQRIKKIVSAIRRVCHVPLTVKIRAGWSPNEPAADEIGRIIEGCGADALTLHPRFVTQGFTGQADWSIITRVKEKLGIPVIGNGDVCSAFSAHDMKRQTGCDGVMIGRGARGNPWIFKQIFELENGLEITHPDLSELRTLIMEHFRLLSLHKGEEAASRIMRGLVIWYTKGLPNSSRFRSSFTGIKDYDMLIKALDRYFSTLNDDKQRKNVTSQ